MPRKNNISETKIMQLYANRVSKIPYYNYELSYWLCMSEYKILQLLCTLIVTRYTVEARKWNDSINYDARCTEFLKEWRVISPHYISDNTFSFNLFFNCTLFKISSLKYWKEPRIKFTENILWQKCLIIQFFCIFKPTDQWIERELSEKGANFAHTIAKLSIFTCILI